MIHFKIEYAGDLEPEKMIGKTFKADCSVTEVSWLDDNDIEITMHIDDIEEY